MTQLAWVSPQNTCIYTERKWHTGWLCLLTQILNTCPPVCKITSGFWRQLVTLDFSQQIRFSFVNIFENNVIFSSLCSAADYCLRSGLHIWIGHKFPQTAPDGLQHQYLKYQSYCRKYCVVTSVMHCFLFLLNTWTVIFILYQDFVACVVWPQELCSAPAERSKRNEAVVTCLGFLKIFLKDVCIFVRRVRRLKERGQQCSEVLDNSWKWQWNDTLTVFYHIINKYTVNMQSVRSFPEITTVFS